MTRTGRARAALALAAVVLSAGCGVPRDDQPRALHPTEVPFQRPLAPADPQPQGDREVGAYLVQVDRLVRTERRLDEVASPLRVLERLLEGPTSAELDAGLTTAIPDGVVSTGFALEGGVAVVSLTGFEQVRSDQTTAFAQIVTTLDELPGVEGVRFRRGDEDLPVPRGDGLLTVEPLTSEDYAELLVPPATSLPTPSPPAPSPPVAASPEVALPAGTALPSA